MMQLENKTKTNLQDLRDRIARLEGRRLGRPSQAWAGGLADSFFDRPTPGGAFHEILATRIVARGAATGFALALARALAGPAGRLLWIHGGGAARELGRAYAPGLSAYGIDPDRVWVLSATRPQDALWAAEEALSTAPLGAVILEMDGAPAVLDATAVRRLKLRGEASGVPGLLLRHGSEALRDAGLPVDLRWQVAAAPSAGAPRHLVGAPAFALDLVKNRFGRTGPLTVAWEAFDARFVPLLGDPVAASSHRPAHAPGTGGALRRTG